MPHYCEVRRWKSSPCTAPADPVVLGAGSLLLGKDEPPRSALSSLKHTVGMREWGPLAMARLDYCSCAFLGFDGRVGGETAVFSMVFVG